jgi:hypothetical protein
MFNLSISAKKVESESLEMESFENAKKTAVFGTISCEYKEK